MSSNTTSDRVVPPAPPGEIFEALRAITSAGHRCWLVGESLLELARGEFPLCYQASSTISEAELLALEPRAVATAPDRGIVTLPTRRGPIDICTGRAQDDADLEWARAEFSVLAIAIDIESGVLLDPHGGIRDLREGRLRRIEDRPLCDMRMIFKAARLASKYALLPELKLDPAFQSEIERPGTEVAGLTALELRRDLRAILTGPNVAAGLSILKSSSVEFLLLPGVREDSHSVVASLEPDLTARMAAWMRDASARQALRRARFGVRFSHLLYRLLDHHPIDQNLDDASEGSLYRTFKRVSEPEIEILLQLRNAEIAVLDRSGKADLARETRSRLDQVEEALDRFRKRRTDESKMRQLEITGSEIMSTLPCEAGPIVGQALEFLRDCVERDPSCNNPESLRAHLATWSEKP